MKNSTKMIIVILLMLFIRCSSDNDNMNEIIIPTNLQVQATIVGEDANNPNGDGSGLVKFTIKASNADYYRVSVNNKVLEFTENTFSYIFTNAGTNDYQLLIEAYNSNGNTSVQYTVTVFVETETEAETEAETDTETDTDTEKKTEADTELKLIWQDEFDRDGRPNASNWGYDIGKGNNGWGNNESQFYTDRLDNALVEDGVLKIIAKREDYQGSKYTSARLLTSGKFDFTYARVDVRAKLPAGGGVWPAIWMLGSNIGTVGWPICGEIDIMEYVGNKPGHISSAIHTSSSFGATINYKATEITNETTAFHLYSMVWTEESITFMLDEVAYYVYNPATKNVATWPFTDNQFIILNIAIGGTLGGNIDPNFDTSTMEVDYVRVYQ